LRGASDDVLAESYQATLGELEQVSQPSCPEIKSGLDILSLEYPQAKKTDPAPIIDPSIVRHIEQSGFIDALYKKYVEVPSRGIGTPRVYDLWKGITAPK